MAYSALGHPLVEQPDIDIWTNIISTHKKNSFLKYAIWEKYQLKFMFYFIMTMVFSNITYSLVSMSYLEA